jgi:hypothetical protein
MRSVCCTRAEKESQIPVGRSAGRRDVIQRFDRLTLCLGVTYLLPPSFAENRSGVDAARRSGYTTNGSLIAGLSLWN